MIYPFYTDKAKHNKDDTYIDVKLEHPIICHDDEYLKIKVLDVQYMNNMYNVSSYLQNNVIKTTNTPITYTEPVLVDILNDIYDTSLPIIDYKPSTTLTYDTDNDIQFITGTNYKIHYKDDQILDGVDEFENIFYTDSSTELKFNEYDNYIIVEKLDENDTNYLRQVSYALKKTIITSSSIDDVTFRLVVKGSYDNITYSTIPIMTADTELITFQGDDPQYAIIEKIRIDLINRINYKYYKFSIDGSLESGNANLIGYKLNYLKLYEWSQQPYTNGAEVTNDLIIPDGFYKASTYIAKIKELLSNYDCDITLDSLTNKVSITHTKTDSVKYPYTDPNGVIDLEFPSINIQNNIGINTELISLPIYTTFVGNTNIDLVNYKKIIIATDLDFTQKSTNELITGNDDGTGVGNILVWIDSDSPPFTCVKYYNYENSSYRIENKNVSNITFTLYNEKRQKLNLDNMLIHFEIEKLRLK
jgi:hypothetical protein